METQAQIITSAIIDNAMDYAKYRAFITERLEQHQSTGTTHTEAIVGYTVLNEQRMKRLDKTVRLTAETIAVLQAVERPQLWLVITEGWCGDAAQSIPIIAKMAAETSNIELKFILRDEHLEIIDAFLTNGGRSIPKLIILDAVTLEVLNDWGPRPAELQTFFWEAKNNPNFDYPEVQKQLQLWYTKDKGVSTQREIIEMIKE